MEIKIKYFSKDYPRLKKLSVGDWIDLRIDNYKGHITIDKDIFRGIVGNVIIDADKDVIDLAYYAGLGTKCGLGLGLLEIIWKNRKADKMAERLI